ncbi:phytochromobilin:ferredoxin oxidoreductase, chloroplastic-like [Telopea speciosissima]|uniref:phytochromobilin:ferredoxin oxidoreductase, chloroplastic-like n=1 Tax=Telopea speciosissima TaxID=54955 RepID=UPI001CC7FA08|nr:phytochromobilin:ferredoxin oxidoreductase, chloroplastic-like [Telopea speciosissima]
MDGQTKLQMLSFHAPKIRLLGGLTIEGSEGMQVLDFSVLPEPEFVVPICANFFTAASMNIVVLDLNPLYDAINHGDYKQKYYERLRLAAKYIEAWLGLMDQAAEETDDSRILCNHKAQHKYLNGELRRCFIFSL